MLQSDAHNLHSMITEKMPLKMSIYEQLRKETILKQKPYNNFFCRFYCETCFIFKMYFKLEIFVTDFRIICKSETDTFLQYSICQLMDTMVKRKIPCPRNQEGLLHCLLYLYPQSKPEVQVSVISDFRNKNISQILHPFAQTNVLLDDILFRGYHLSTAEYYLVRSVTEVLFFPTLSNCFLPGLLI